MKDLTPKEKAKELIMDMLFCYQGSIDAYTAKQCALIAVNEILKSLSYKSLNDSPYTTLEARQFYVRVKQEIEKL
jgi:hypothetical protein